VHALLAPGATVVLSGLLPAQVNAALAAWRTQGLVLRRRDTFENWVTLILARPH
jgi:ribosomal protein L11 methyltransferase